MGIFGRSKYEKGGIVRGSIQFVTGVCKYTAGKAKEVVEGKTPMSTGLKYNGVKDMTKGLKKVLGIPVKKG